MPCYHSSVAKGAKDLVLVELVLKAHSIHDVVHCLQSLRLSLEKECHFFLARKIQTYGQQNEPLRFIARRFVHDFGENSWLVARAQPSKLFPDLLD